MEGVQGNGEASSSAAKTHQQATIWTELHRAHDVLAGLNSDRKPHELHALDQVTCSKVPSSVHPSKGKSGSASLSHEQFKSLVSDLRESVKHFRGSAAAALAAPTAAVEQGQQPSAANSVRNSSRYYGLLKEKSQHISQLHSAQGPLFSLQSQLKQRQKNALPAKLHIGALAPDGGRPFQSQESQTQGKRKRDDADALPIVNSAQSAATAALATFSAVLEDVAKEMRLETFGEAVTTNQAVFDIANAEILHTHTLTLGGRLIVLDLDLGLQLSPARLIQPSVKVKLSFTTDASQEEGSQASVYRLKLTQCLESDIKAILSLVWADQVVHPAKGQSIDETRLRLARGHYARLRNNIETLANTDHQSVVQDVSDSQSHHGLDLFKISAELAASVETASHSEAQKLRSGKVKLESGQVDEDNAKILILQGHGLPVVHTGHVGLVIVYDVCGEGTSLLTQAKVEGALSTVSAAHKTTQPLHLWKARIESVVSPYGLQQPASIAAQVRVLSASELGNFAPTPHQGSSVSVTHLAHLDPPVVVSRQAASRLHNVLGWKSGLGESSQARDTASMETWLGNVVRSSTSRQDGTPPQESSSSRIQLELCDPSSKAQDQGLTIDVIPFANLSQLYAALGVLQETTAMTKLVGPLLQGEEENVQLPPDQQKQVVSVEFVPGVQTVCAVRLSTTLVDPEKQEAWHLSAAISRNVGNAAEADSMYHLQVEIKDALAHLKASDESQYTFSPEDLAAISHELDKSPNAGGLSKAAEKLVQLGRVRTGIEPVPNVLNVDTVMDIDADTSEPRPSAAEMDNSEEAASGSQRQSPSASTSTAARGSSRKSPSHRRSSASPSQSSAGIHTRRRSQQQQQQQGSGGTTSPKVEQQTSTRMTRRSSAAVGSDAGGAPGSPGSPTAEDKPKRENTKAKSPPAPSRRRSNSSKAT